MVEKHNLSNLDNSSSSKFRNLVIMPAFNEEDSIGPILREVFTHFSPSSVLVVDDGSSDQTRLVALEHGAMVMTLPFNMGVGGAMRSGFKFALEENYLNAIQLDADGQHNPNDISLLLEELDVADIVIGARFAGKGDYSVRGPRKWAMVFLSKVLSRICGTELTDTTSGFKAMGPRALSLFSQRYPAEYLGDTVEALVLAAKAGLIIKQVPVEMRARYGGEPSHGPLKSGIFLARAFLALVIGISKPSPREK